MTAIICQQAFTSQHQRWAAPRPHIEHSRVHRKPPNGTKGRHSTVIQTFRSSAATSVHCRAAADGVDSQQPASSTSAWDVQTGRLVSVSTVFFLLLLVPQIVQNAGSLLAGNSSALAALSWVVCPCPCSFGRLLLQAVLRNSHEQCRDLSQPSVGTSPCWHTSSTKRRKGQQQSRPSEQRATMRSCLRSAQAGLALTIDCWTSDTG